MRWLLGLGLLVSTPVFALTTAYVSFDHPDGWLCELSQGVWICQSKVEPDRRESVVLSIATMATEWDTLENYEDYLKQPRTIQDEDGSTITSKVTYTRKRNINGVVWVDSLQFNSELPGFWARYLSTVQNKLAILITYIVSDERYKQLAPQFERMVASLKPNAEFELNQPSKQGEPPFPGRDRLGPQKDLLKERGIGLPKKPKETKKPEEEPENELPTGTIILAAAVVAFAAVVMRLRRRRRRSGPPAGPKTPTAVTKKKTG